MAFTISDDDEDDEYDPDRDVDENRDRRSVCVRFSVNAMQQCHNLFVGDSPDETYRTGMQCHTLAHHRSEHSIVIDAIDRHSVAIGQHSVEIDRHNANGCASLHHRSCPTHHSIHCCSHRYNYHQHPFQFDSPLDTHHNYRHSRWPHLDTLDPPSQSLRLPTLAASHSLVSQSRRRHFHHTQPTTTPPLTTTRL